MTLFLFWFASLLILYIWFGYFLIVNLLVIILSRRPHSFDTEFAPPVTIIISAYNEAEVIRERIKNLLALNYQKDLIEIIIASDGSTDQTVINIATNYPNVRVVDFKKNRGTALVYNDVVQMVKSDILVFTDADSIFDKDFLQNIIAPFADDRVGLVVGKLVYKIAADSSMAHNESRYWQHESRLREKESRLGLLNNSTGAGMALRRKLYKQLSPYDHIDTATVIDVIMQGYRVVYQKQALVYDLPPHNAHSEWRVRVRGTAKTTTSIIRRVSMREWLRYPVLLWSIFSRRLGRYLTPYFLLIVFVANIFLLSLHWFYLVTFISQLIFLLFIFIGWCGDKSRKNFPVFSQCYSLFIAFSGMAVGLIRAVTNRVPITFKTDDNL